jgi:hypothetical protein
MKTITPVFLTDTAGVVERVVLLTKYLLCERLVHYCILHQDFIVISALTERLVFFWPLGRSL